MKNKLEKFEEDNEFCLYFETDDDAVIMRFKNDEEREKAYVGLSDHLMNNYNGYKMRPNNI